MKLMMAFHDFFVFFDSGAYSFMGLSKSQNVIATLPGWKSLEMSARLPIGTFWRERNTNHLFVLREKLEV
ncbi:hypothetical protein TNCV_1618201 [Trichonephila clavipes]|nr:hypothetical protein TNCV_1618201 [Trichonephila clavipes]